MYISDWKNKQISDQVEQNWRFLYKVCLKFIESFHLCLHFKIMSQICQNTKEKVENLLKTLSDEAFGKLLFVHFVYEIKTFNSFHYRFLPTTWSTWDTRFSRKSLGVSQKLDKFQPASNYTKCNQTLASFGKMAEQRLPTL